MKKRRKRHSLAIASVLASAIAIASLLDLKEAVAQSSDSQTPPCCSDMWDPLWMQRDMWGSGQMGSGMNQRMERHWTFMHQGIPVEYRGARNPLSLDTATINAGRILYEDNCASCHGATGMGDGEAGRSLNPSPALLAYMIQMPMAVDEYLLWSISDGGEAFGTDMPAFKGALTTDEIWTIVTYMRTGFPDGTTQP